MTDKTGVTERTYDELGRTKSKTISNIGEVKFIYDNVEGLEKGYSSEITKDPKGNITKKVYDEANRLTKVIDGDRTTTYTYYDNGSKESTIYPDGSRGDYNYNKNNALKTLINKKANGEVLTLDTSKTSIEEICSLIS